MSIRSFRPICMSFGFFSLLWIPVYGETPNANRLTYVTEIADFNKEEMQRYGISPVHPYAFELKTLQSSMWALAYQDRQMTWSKKKHVFDRPAIKALGSHLLVLFKKIGKRQRVIFKIIKPSGKTLFAGDTFLTPEGLNWRVTNFRGSRKKVDDFSVLGDDERLVPLKGQAYKTKEEHEGLIQNITNWVIFSSIAPEKYRILPEIISGDNRDHPSAEDITRDVKKRLKVLENLKKEGVITDLEYNRRRQEILKGF